MNCPKCGASCKLKGVTALQGVYDPENKEYYRRCRCNTCKAIFHTIEYEIECNDNIQKIFDDAISENDMARLSKKRFDDYRASQKEIRRMKRWGVK